MVIPVLIGLISAGPNSVAVFDQFKGCELVSVQPGEATVSLGGEELVLRIGDMPTPVSPVERRDSTVRVASSYRDFLVSEGLLSVLMEAGVRRTPEGYQVLDIEPGSAYEMAGIKNGDIITEIDGAQLDSPWRAIQALQQVKGADDFTFKFIRDGKEAETKIEVR